MEPACILRAMEYLTEPGYQHAKMGCYNCENVTDGVSLDTVIEGEGAIFICTGCIKDAGKLASVGRARAVREQKAEARRLAAATT